MFRHTHIQKVTKGLPAFFYIEDEQIFCGDTFPNMLNVLIIHSDYKWSVDEFALKQSLPDQQVRPFHELPQGSQQNHGPLGHKGPHRVNSPDYAVVPLIRFANN